MLIHLLGKAEHRPYIHLFKALSNKNYMQISMTKTSINKVLYYPISTGGICDRTWCWRLMNTFKPIRNMRNGCIYCFMGRIRRMCIIIFKNKIKIPKQHPKGNNRVQFYSYVQPFYWFPIHQSLPKNLRNMHQIFIENTQYLKQHAMYPVRV